MKLKKIFIDKTKQVVDNQDLIDKIEFATGKYYSAQEKAEKRFKNLELARDFISKEKQKILDNFDFYYNQFIEKFKSNGGKVFLASDSQEANKLILKILKDNSVKTVVKSKSMATEEIELNANLEKNGIEVFETDLGEFIVQISQEKPFHIISPALHKSKQDVIKLYKEKFNTSENASIEDITNFTREYLRQKFLNAQAGITGANFLISDIGAIALTENEGNAILSSTLPKIQIIVAGIEKLIPSAKSISLFWQMISFRGTGQILTSFNSILFPTSDTYLILLDNGRFEIMKNQTYNSIFKCLRCGACFYYCPVYKSIGGHSYNSPYGGPMGSILSSLLFGLENYGHLVFACTLCNKCVEVCPAKVPLTELILKLRNEQVEKNLTPKTEKIAMKMFAFLSQKRFLYDLNEKIKNLSLPLIKKLWGEKRDFPKFKKSFLKRNKK